MTAAVAAVVSAAASVSIGAAFAVDTVASVDSEAFAVLFAVVEAYQNLTAAY